MTSRTVPKIDADLAAWQAEWRVLEARRDVLMRERRSAVKVRNRAIIADFDAGHTPKRIAVDHGMPPNTVRTIIWQAGRKVYKTKTPISHLPADQQRIYAQLRRNGHGPGVARQMATAPSTRGAAEPAGVGQ